MIEVRLIENKGCVWVMGAVFSLGLLPLLAGRAARTTPERLTEEEMILRNGTRIPWGQFTGAKATEVFLNRRYIRTRYVFTYTGGTVALENDRVHDSERVIGYILAHLPPQART
jgi:hypothetical protein